MVTYLQSIMEECSHPVGCFRGIPCSRSPCDSLLTMNAPCPSASTVFPVTRSCFSTKALHKATTQGKKWLMRRNLLPFHGQKLMIAYHSSACQKFRSHHLNATLQPRNQLSCHMVVACYAACFVCQGRTWLPLCRINEVG